MIFRIKRNDEEHIVDYDSEEFKKAREQFFERLHKAAKEKSDKIVTGNMGARVGGVTQGLPFPWGCPSLEIYTWKGENAIAYFCGEEGCLCSPCRKDLMGSLIDHNGNEWTCPTEMERMLADAYNDEDIYGDE